MEGFLDGQPILVKVSWADAEVPLLAGEATSYGLRAHTRNANGITRWFVPWQAVQYVKQDIPDEPAGDEPELIRPSAPGGNGTGGNGASGRSSRAR